MGVGFEVGHRRASVSLHSTRVHLVNFLAALPLILLLTTCIPDSDNPGVASDVANLSSLELTDSAQQPVGLSPSFDGNVTSYTADVGGTIDSITVEATVANPGNTTIRLQLPDGQSSVLGSGQTSSPIPLSQGPNNIVVTVDAPGLTKAYTIVVNRGTNANLQSLVVVTEGGLPVGLSPAFAPATTEYTATTGFSTQAVSVTATLADSTSTFTINGASATSGVPSGNIPLNVGTTTITIRVQAQNGAIKTYSVLISRAGTPDLANLVTSAGPLNPSFSPNTLTYTASTGFGTSSATITPTAADTSATITINNQAAISGQGFPVQLNVGANTFTIVVTAQATPPTRTYALTITRAQPSSNANLSNLTVNPGSLSPEFSPSIFGYIVTVGSNTSSIQITPTLASGTASLLVNNQAASSGQGVNVPLNSPAPSTTVVPITVTAENGAVQTYTITVNRVAPASGNSNLGSLAVSPGTLSPSFNPNTNNYSVSVSNTTTSIVVTATTQDSGATMTINGQAVQSGQAFTVSNLQVGNNTITIRVTAPAGNAEDYVVTVNRAAPPSNNANLSNLAVSPGTLSPGFSSSTFNYSVSLPFANSSINVTPTAASGSSTITVNGQGVNSGGTISVPLGVGNTVIVVSVTAQAGNFQNYVISVNRAAASSNNDLSNLTVSPGTLSPNFSANQTAYSVGVGSAVSSITVTATLATGTSTMTVNGQATASGQARSVPLNAAGTPTSIAIVVTAQNGAAKTYTVTVNRAAPLSGNNNLSALSVSAGTLTPPFAATTINYNVAAPNATASTTITATVADPTATLTINGAPATSGIASPNIPLAVGPNPIQVVVTAQNGSPKTYTITITRAP